MDVGVYVPQLGLTYAQVLHRARRCEELGIGSLWLYDHLYGPGFPDLPSLEAWTLATALLTATEQLHIGHLVLCNQFRDPVVLAKMVTTLDHIAPGRLRLGLGSGSIADEHHRAGLPWGTVGDRSARLAETLTVLHTALHDGMARDLPIVPTPASPPPIIVGGVGEKYTLPLVARYADVWNIPTYALGELDRKIAVLRELCDDIGRDPAEIVLSIEVVLALAADGAALPAARAMAEKRFGGPGFGLHEGGLIGTPDMVVARLRELYGLGFRQVVLFTHDRASDQTLELLASAVLAEVRAWR